MKKTNLDNGLIGLAPKKGYKLVNALGSVVGNVSVLPDNVDDWWEVSEADIQAEKDVKEKEERYTQRVEALIRERYSVSQELAILRQRDTKTEEFADYNAFAEGCKEQARIEIYGNNSLAEQSASR